MPDNVKGVAIDIKSEERLAFNALKVGVYDGFKGLEDGKGPAAMDEKKQTIIDIKEKIAVARLDLEDEGKKVTSDSLAKQVMLNARPDLSAGERIGLIEEGRDAMKHHAHPAAEVAHIAHPPKPSAAAQQPAKM